MGSKHVRVGLLWHSVNSANLGVGALTVSNLAIIRRAAAEAGVEVSFDLFGWVDAGRPHYAAAPDVTIHPMGGRMLLDLRGGFQAAVRRCDVVFDIGAGDSFADIYGWKRFAYLMLSKLIVLNAGVPLVLSPQTIGPFKGRAAALSAREVLLRCERVVARDHQSYAVLEEFRLGERAEQAVDVAFRLPFARPERPAGDGIHVGINVSALLFNGGYTGDNMFGLTVDYRALTERLIRHFSAIPGCTVHLVPHVMATGMPVEDDYLTASELLRKFPAAVLAPAFATPSEAKSYIAGLDFFTGARMHACIAAFSAGVPVVPQAYSRKFTGLFGSLAYGHVADLAALDTDGAFAAVTGAFERRDELAAQVRRGNLIAAEKLSVYEDLVRTILAGGEHAHVRDAA